MQENAWLMKKLPQNYLLQLFFKHILSNQNCQITETDKSLGPYPQIFQILSKHVKVTGCTSSTSKILLGGNNYERRVPLFACLVIQTYMTTTGVYIKNFKRHRRYGMNKYVSMDGYQDGA